MEALAERQMDVACVQETRWRGSGCRFFGAIGKRYKLFWMAMRKLGVEEWLVSAVMSMYSGAKTVVRTVYGNSKSFEVKVGMHQGSALSRVVPDKRPLNGCMCVCVCACVYIVCLFISYTSFFPYLSPPSFIFSFENRSALFPDWMS